MPTFPKLKTSAVAQYPATKTLAYANQVLKFLGGDEQRYRESRAALRRWVVRLDLLDHAELAALELFFLMQQGRMGTFLFVDPWDQTQYPDCSLDQDIFELELRGETQGRTELLIRENRK